MCGSFALFLWSHHSSAVKQSEHDQNPCHEPISKPKTTSNQNQEILLNKLEELVRNLTEIVTKLESKLSHSKAALIDERSALEKLGGSAKRKYENKISNKKVEDGEYEGKIQDAERA